MSEWFENEEFWVDFKDILFHENRMEKTSYQVDRFVEILDLKEDDRVLDLVCGIGRHSIELARRGFDVTAVDLTEQYIKEARNKADGENLDVEFVRADMREFERTESYDAVINFFTSFGYFEGKEENLKVLENVHSSLKPAGKFLLDVMGKEVLDKVYSEKDSVRVDGGFFVEERNFKDDGKILESNWKLIKDDGEVKEHKFIYRVYKEDEIISLLKEAGFTDVKTYGDLELSRYDGEADRLIVLAEK